MATPRARFKMRRTGVGELLRSQMIKQDMETRAKVIKAVAAANSPVGDAARDPHPGLYKASWHVSSRAHGGRRRNRATATVYNTAPHARWVEYGNEHTGGQHILLLAAAAGGY